MPELKVIEIFSDSSVSWEDAARQAIEKASLTLHNVQSIRIREYSAESEGGTIAGYRVNAMVSFVPD